MRVPVSWLRDYVPIEMPLDELATRLSVATAEVEGIERRGVPDTDGNLGLLPRRARPRGGEAPERRPAAAAEGRRRRGRAAPDRLRRVELRRRRHRRRRAAGGGAAGRPAARRREVRGEISDGMILAEDEVGLGTDHAGSCCWTRPSRARRSPTCCRSSTTCCSSSRPATGPTCSRSTASRARSRRSTTSSWRRRLEPIPSRQATSRSTSRSTTSRAARATSAGSSGTSGSRRRRCGSAPGCTRPGCARSRTSSTSTNYVMLALGNPLHAFDFPKLRGSRIVVRRASPARSCARSTASTASSPLTTS